MRNAPLSLIFSCVGHFFFHYFAAMYFTIVIVMADEWQKPFHDLIELWTPAAIIIGLASLPAGRLADVWSAPGMLVLMFLGMGLATIACSFAGTELALAILLGLIGLFGAIYHPVGLSWLVRSSRGSTGKKLAVNGIFGGLGSAAAAGVTGLILEISGWRAAFYLPGVLCLLTGAAMLWFVMRGEITDSRSRSEDAGHGSGSGSLRAFMLLLFPMFAIGLVYSVVQATMPKLFEEGLVETLSGNLAAVGGMVAAVYIIGAIMQLVGGHLADRYSLKVVYLLCWVAQIPLLILLAYSGELTLFACAVVLVIFNTSALPSENILLSRYAPERHHGIAFGVKFILAFGAAPLGVALISWVRESTGSFQLLILGLAGLAAISALVALLLPSMNNQNTVAAAAE